MVLTGARRLEIQQRPIPKPGPKEVLVAVRACGICGSDVHGYDGSTGRRIPPLVMGHEAAGEIVELGADVTRWQVGQRVALDSTLSCGACPFCLSGQTNLCDQRRVLGVSCDAYRCDGAFAEYIAIPEHTIYRLPDGVGYAEASMIEPLSVAMHAVERAPPGPEDSVLVVGAGMIGLLIMQVLRARGCGTIVVCDLDDSRLKLAQRLGADVVVSPKRADVVATCLELSRGRGLDLAIEAVGRNSTVATAIRCLRKGGALTLVGNIESSVNLPLQDVVTRELVLRGSCASSGEYPDCLEMLQRQRIDLDPLISAIAPLETGPEWMDRLYAAEAGLMKVVLLPLQ
jgi:L-iditol 2-dehydrogenase